LWLVVFLLDRVQCTTMRKLVYIISAWVNIIMVRNSCKIFAKNIGARMQRLA